jgi:hypothetical protein
MTSNEESLDVFATPREAEDSSTASGSDDGFFGLAKKDCNLVVKTRGPNEWVLSVMSMPSTWQSSWLTWSSI